MLFLNAKVRIFIFPYLVDGDDSEGEIAEWREGCGCAGTRVRPSCGNFRHLVVRSFVRNAFLQKQWELVSFWSASLLSRPATLPPRYYLLPSYWCRYTAPHRQHCSAAVAWPPTLLSITIQTLIAMLLNIYVYLLGICLYYYSQMTLLALNEKTNGH